MSRPISEAEWAALARYLAGESPAEEAAAVGRRLEEDAGLASFVKGIDRPSRSAGSGPVDVEAALARVRARLDPGGPEVIDLARRRRTVRILQLAAALALVGGVSLLWRLVKAPTPPPDAVTHVTATGQTDSIRLGDGTLVVLAPSSRLQVLPGYGAGSRSVELQGEGYFDVTDPSGPPFTVRAGPARVVDLGTRFTVRTGAGEIRVMVESGSVRLEDTVRSSARSLTLRAGQAGVFAPGRGELAAAAPAERDLAWVRGRLVFDNAPLSRVREDLRRWFGISLIFADTALADRHLSARFAGETSEQVLKVLELTLGVSVERRGDSAIVRPGRGTFLPNR